MPNLIDIVQSLQNLMADFMVSLIPLLRNLVVIAIMLRASYWLLLGRKKDLGSERKFQRQIIMVILVIIALLALIFSLPVSESARNQLLGLFGLIISGIFAFSSTNIVKNFMSGVLLRITRPFKTGDFIRVGDHFGRVSQRGLFDTEIQSVKREFISLPNSYLVTNPITAINKSGTIVSMQLSLGYDVNHATIEPLLIKAAEKCGLKEPFTHILELGDFSITYRVSGLLEDVKWFVSAQSDLCRSVLDTLHIAGVEIVSPTFMNQRRISQDDQVIPPVQQWHKSRSRDQNDNDKAERIVFDKAEEAARIEGEIEVLKSRIESQEELLKTADGEEKDKLEKQLETVKNRLKELEQDRETKNKE